MTWSGIKGCGYTRFQRRIIVWWVSGASILHHTLKRIPKYLIKLYIFASYWHPKLAQFRSAGQYEQTSQTGYVNRTNRFGKHCKISNWTAPLRRAHRDNRNAYIERPIWSPGGGVNLCLQEDLHLVWPVQGWSDWSKQPIRVRSCILTRDMFGFDSY